MALWMNLLNTASAQYPSDLKGGATTTAGNSPFTTSRASSRVKLIGFQPRNAGAAAAATVAVANHSGATQITLPCASAGTEQLPYQPLGIVLDGVGLKLTASNANCGGILFFEDAS